MRQKLLAGRMWGNIGIANRSATFRKRRRGASFMDELAGKVTQILERDPDVGRFWSNGRSAKTGRCPKL
jgi:hypothetical protein